MAKTSYEIRMNYQRAIQQAEALEEASRVLKNRAAQKIETAVDELRHGWKGHNAEQYMNKCETVKTQITESASRLDTIASMIRQAAQRTYAADMHALQVAKNRNY